MYFFFHLLLLLRLNICYHLTRKLLISTWVILYQWGLSNGNNGLTSYCLSLGCWNLLSFLNFVTSVVTFCWCLQKDLEARGGDNQMMHTVFQIYLNFLRSSQSETLQKHVFASWRAFIKKVSKDTTDSSIAFII